MADHLTLDDSALGAIADAGRLAWPNEACGLIIAAGKKQRVVACANVAENPRDFFMLAPVDYAACAAEGEVLAVWHTHPQGKSKPSDADRAGCENSDLPWIILGLVKQGDEFVLDAPTVIQPTGFQMPLVGRPYVSGVFDCYSIIRDWYARERQVLINDYPRREDGGRMGYSFFLERYAEEGFARVDGDKAEAGDVFVLKVNAGEPNHLALYLGNDQILHHAHGRLSARAVYGGYWAKHTVAHLRYTGATC